MKQTRTQINTEISTYVYTNTTGLIKGDTVRDRMLNIAESFLNILTDADQPNGYVSINAIGLANTSSIKSGTPTGLFLRDDGNWATLGATWGGIGGLISNQTDLVALVNTRLALSDVDTDVNLTANSDSKVASQKAVKSYINYQLLAFEPLITPGTSSQYWRGDKTWQTLALGTVLGISNTTAGNNIVLSGTDVVTDSSSAVSFLDLNNQRLYFFDGTNNFGVLADLSGGVIGLSARNMASISLEHSYVQTLVAGVNIGSYSQSSGNETKLTFSTTTSEISSTYSTYAGLTYNADYSANYTNRSLVDKGYVSGGFVPYTGATGSVTMGANNIFFASGYGIDVTATGGSDILNIGATNADVINIGGTGTTVNIIGNVTEYKATQSYVTDQLITINRNGPAASASGTGFEIEENAIVTGYFKTNAGRDAYLLLAPSVAYYSELSLASLTANRTHTLPDISGTLASQANNLSVFAATTSAQLAGIISDETGTGSLVFGTQPTFSQWITVPRIYGGTGVNDGIDFYSTSGNGTVGSVAHRFRGGNNGAVTILEMFNNGNFRIPNNRTIQGTDSIGTDRSLFVWSSGDNITIIGRPGTTDINLNPTSSGIGLYVKSTGDGGIGVASPFARWHIVKTTEQLRVGYDASNYISTTIASSGEVTKTLVGTTKTLNISSSGSTVLKINSSVVITYVGTDGGGGYAGTNTAHAFRIYSANVQRLSFAGSGTGDCTVSEGLNFILGTTTGSIIASATGQKLGIWGATPIVQPANTVAIDTLLVNIGLRASGGVALFDTDLKLSTVGKGIYIKEGTNATMGSFSSVHSGNFTVDTVVNTTKVTANSRIILTVQSVTDTTNSTVPVAFVLTRTAGTSFTVRVTSDVDPNTIVVSWVIIEPS